MSSEAIILAGGFGTRLQSVVNDVPKPMAPVCGRPFLAYVMESLRRAGIEHIILSVGYRSEVIMDYFGHQYSGIPITYCVEKEPLGTGGGIRLAAEYMQTESTFILNGDTYFDVDFGEIKSFHQANNFELSIALREVADTDRYGAVKLHESRITGFTEKGNGSSAGYINGGIYLANKTLLETIPLHVKYSFEVELLQSKFEQFSFGGCPQNGYFIDIGIPEDYKRANVEFRTLFGR